MSLPNFDTQTEPDPAVLENLLASHNAAVEQAADIKVKFEALGLGTPKILMIDDDASAREIIEMTVGGLGYEFEALTSSHNNSSTRDVVREISHLIAGQENVFVNADIIICDLQMPQLNGREVIQHLTNIRKIGHSRNRVFRPGSQVIFFTALKGEEIESVFESQLIQLNLAQPKGVVYSIDGYTLLRKDGKQNMIERMINEKLNVALAVMTGKSE